MTISKTFSTLAEAERFQNRLYFRYDVVKLIKFPFFGSGIYVWEVSGISAQGGKKRVPPTATGKTRMGRKSGKNLLVNSKGSNEDSHTQNL